MGNETFYWDGLTKHVYYRYLFGPNSDSWWRKKKDTNFSIMLELQKLQEKVKPHNTSYLKQLKSFWGLFYSFYF